MGGKIAAPEGGQLVGDLVDEATLTEFFKKPVNNPTAARMRVGTYRYPPKKRQQNGWRDAKMEIVIVDAILEIA